MEKVNFAIRPERITKPFQVLAAWLGTLILVDTAFLYAAARIQSAWLPHALVLAAIFNVWLFLWTMYNMQTKYRPEMQGDEYYSDYLKSHDAEKKSELHIVEATDEIMNKTSLPKKCRPVVEKVLDEQVIKEELSSRFGRSPVMRHLFHKKDGDWESFCDRWRGKDVFERDIFSCLEAGMIRIPDGRLRKAELTDKGIRMMEETK